MIDEENSQIDPIYIVDDESSIRETVEDILHDEGYRTKSCSDSKTLFTLVKEEPPSLLLLDIWLPGANGMEVLQEFKSQFPNIPVIMISGHAGIESAVNSIKLGAFDFLEKPLHLEVLLDKVENALVKARQSKQAKLVEEVAQPQFRDQFPIHKKSLSLVESDVPQRTLKHNVVLNGAGLLTGRNTGIILSPLGVNEGVVFQSLDGQTIPGNITSLENYSQLGNNQTFTANSTTLIKNNRRVRTIEHLMGVLSMFGITNVMIKADEEIPNIDSSGERFCRLIHEAGIEEQSERAKKVVIHEKILIGDENENLDKKFLYVEPHHEYEVQMRINFPEPIISEQKYTFNPNKQSFEKEIAPARSFNTFGQIDMAQRQGKARQAFLDAHIIIHDGKVINTQLRFEDEFVRHKILDLMGDFYLLGYPVEGRFVANMTGHSYNQALAKTMYDALFID